MIPYIIKKVKVRQSNGEIREMFQLTSRENVKAGNYNNGFGDTLHETEEEAQKLMELNKILDIYDKNWRLRLIEEEKIALAAKLERENLDGFDAGMTPIKRGKVIKTLNKEYSSDGRIVILRDIIRNCIKEGRVIEMYQGERILINKTTETFKTEKNLTKTGMDYAAHLINLRSMTQPRESEAALTNFMGDK